VIVPATEGPLSWHFSRIDKDSYVLAQAVDEIAGRAVEDLRAV